MASSLDAPGALHAAVQSYSRGGELILLHADRRRLRLLLNLIAELAAWEVRHIFVLGFSATVCDDLAQAGSTVGCGTMTYMRTGPLAADVERSGISFNVCLVVHPARTLLCTHTLHEHSACAQHTSMPGSTWRGCRSLTCCAGSSRRSGSTCSPSTRTSPCTPSRTGAARLPRLYARHDLRLQGRFVGRRAEGAVLAVPHLANLASWGPGLTLSATHSGRAAGSLRAHMGGCRAAVRSGRRRPIAAAFHCQANANIGFMYVRNATRGGPVHRLLVRTDGLESHAPRAGTPSARGCNPCALEAATPRV